MASRPASVAGEVSLEPLKAWIAEKEEHMREYGIIAPLTDEERRALAVLVPRPQQPTRAAPPPDDGDLGDTDWVSLLMRYTQTHKGAHVPPKYDEEQVARTYSNSPLWRYRCQIREAPDQWFPDIPKDGTTYDARSDTGLYVRKKDARQYAARSACKWLMANNYMPTDGKSVTFPFSGGMRPICHTVPGPVAVPQPLPSKRPFSEMSFREMPHGQQGRLGQLPPQSPMSSLPPSVPQSPSPPQSSQSSLPLYIKPQLQQRLQHPQPPPLPAALLPTQHRAEPMPTLGSLYTTSDPSAGLPSTQARVQSMASWKRPRSGGSMSSSSSDRDIAVPPAGGRESPTAVTTTLTQGHGNPPAPRVNSSGHALVKPKPPQDRFTANFEEITNWDRLQMLCRLLRVGNPKDDLKPGNEGAEGIFSGRITLIPNKGAKNGKEGKDGTAPVVVLPPGVGEVQDVYTRKAAREKAARSVLDYLQKSMTLSCTV